MGLDMYLYALERKAGESDDEVMERRNNELNETMETELCYWRKVNPLHGFFIRCGEYVNGEDFPPNCFAIVSRDDLLRAETTAIFLSKLIEQDVPNWKQLAEEYLPITEGFFFGNYEYNEIYLDNIKEIGKTLCEVLEKTSEDEFLYYASW